jgi:hypothetical protein
MVKPVKYVVEGSNEDRLCKRSDGWKNLARELDKAIPVPCCPRRADYTDTDGDLLEQTIAALRNRWTLEHTVTLRIILKNPVK